MQLQLQVSRYTVQLSMLDSLSGSWEGGERRNVQLSESGNSLNGPDLFTALLVLWNSLPKPSFTECLARIQGKGAVLRRFLLRCIPFSKLPSKYYVLTIGRTPKGSYAQRGRARHLLETPFSEPLLRTLLRTLFHCKNHRKTTSQNPSENPSPEPFPEPSQNPILERCVAVRPRLACTLDNTLRILTLFSPHGNRISVLVVVGGFQKSGRGFYLTV